MSFGRYGLGLALLVAVLASASIGGVAVRRRWLPLWRGAPARLAEAVAALTILLGIAEVFGALGLFRMPFVAAGTIALGTAAALWLRPAPRTSEQPPASPRVPPYAAAIAMAGVVLVLAQWASTLGPTFHGGMTGPDTLGYHGPIAATFVQRASIVHPPFINTDPTIAFFPMTSELIHAVGILLFSRDVLSPYINLAWFGLAALAAWCIGRPRGAGPASVLAMLVLLNVPAFSSSQPSSADNDVMALALLLASLALLFSSEPADEGPVPGVAGAPAAIALAGAAAGFALATKVTMFAPVGLLVIAVLIALTGARNRVVWVLSVLAASGLWFVRNLIAFGNPVPAVRLGIGPVAFPSAHVPTGATVADYFTNGRIWQELFLPGLHAGFTFMWPLILAAALVGAVAGMAWGFTRLDRLLGVVAILSAVAYAVTPRTGFPFLVAINLRYLAPALVFGVLLLFRVPAARLFRQPWILGLLAAGVVVELANRGAGARLAGIPLLGPTPHFVGTAYMWVAVALALGGFWLAYTRRTTLVPPWVALAALAALAALGLAVWPAERTYLQTRYATGPLAFARNLHHQRIATVGFVQPYPAFGLDLSDSVTEISRHGPHGSQTQVRSCREWRRMLSAGGYSYAITSPPYGLIFTSSPNYAAWTRNDPAARVVRAFPTIGGSITIFKLHGALHPGLCG